MLVQPGQPLGHRLWYLGEGPSRAGVRWNTSSSATSGAISGMTWMALAPVPMTATRLPVRSTSWRHRAGGTTGPRTSRRPGSRGMCGRLSCPTALITASTTTVSSPSGAAQHDGPAAVVVRPPGRHDLGAEPDAVAQPEGVGAGLEVAVQHRLGRVVERPVVALGERVAEVVVGVVDPAARIAVLVPGAADVVVLLDDQEVDARLGEAVPGEQARHAGTDDEDAEVGARARRRPCATWGPGDPRPGAPAPPRAAGGRRPRRAPRPHWLMMRSTSTSVGGGRNGTLVAVGDQRLDRQLADGGLLLVGEAAGRQGQQQRVGPQVVPEQRHVASGVGERREQRLQLGRRPRSGGSRRRSTRWVRSGRRTDWSVDGVGSGTELTVASPAPPSPTGDGMVSIRIRVCRCPGWAGTLDGGVRAGGHRRALVGAPA